MSESRNKIAASIMIAFIFSFSLLFLINYLYPDPIIISEKEFFKNKLSENKIFIIGSSHVRQLNVTSINNYVNNQNQNYTIYNLAESGDRPLERLRTLKEIINSKPDLVVYNISYRDFDSPNEKNEPILIPSLKRYLDEYKEKSSLDQINPKESTLGMILNISEELGFMNESDRFTITNTPFIKYYKFQTEIADIETLKKQSEKDDPNFIHHIEVASKNKQVDALKKIIQSLKNNNIKVIILTSPLHSIFLDKVTHIEKERFEEILEKLQREYEITIYRFDKKYADLPIWYHIDHVSLNENVTIFNEDVSEIIISEIRN